MLVVGELNPGQINEDAKKPAPHKECVQKQLQEHIPQRAPVQQRWSLDVDPKNSIKFLKPLNVTRNDGSLALQHPVLLTVSVSLTRLILFHESRLLEALWKPSQDLLQAEPLLYKSLLGGIDCRLEQLTLTLHVTNISVCDTAYVYSCESESNALCS